MEQKNNFYPIKGYIFEKGKVKTFPTANGEFRVREFKIELRSEYNGKEYKELVEFKAIQEKCDLLDYVTDGDEVEMWFSLGGKYSAYNDKTTGEPKKFHRNELKVLSLKKIQVAYAPDDPRHNVNAPSPETNKVAPPTQFAPPTLDDDDLPFN